MMRGIAVGFGVAALAMASAAAAGQKIVISVASSPVTLCDTNCTTCTVGSGECIVVNDEDLALCETLNPQRLPGRLTFISRMGAPRVRDLLPPLLRAVQDHGHPVVWACDPMHGNTYAAENGRNYRGFNFFSADDDLVLSAIVRGEFTISGLRNKDLRKQMPSKKPGWISRCLKRLRVHGLIKRIGKTYKHYVTELGRRAVLTGLKLREMVIIPALAQPSRAPALG